MSHIMAVSGLHVGIIMSIIWICFRPVEMLVGYLAPLNLTVHYALGDLKRIVVIALTAWYVWLIGAPPSAVRAALMLSLLMLGWMLHRSTSAWRCMVFAALVLIAWDPWTVGQVGFQLSFLAVAGILLFQPWLQSERFPRWLRLVLLSVSAQWFTTPVVAYWFHQVPLLGWVQGLLVVPLMPILVALLLVGILLPSFHFLAVPIEALTAWMGWVAQGIGRVEQVLLGGHLHFYPTWWEVLLAELLLLAIVLYFKVLNFRK
jgi:competence protein ComEC